MACLGCFIENLVSESNLDFRKCFPLKLLFFFEVSGLFFPYILVLQWSIHFHNVY